MSLNATKIRGGVYFHSVDRFQIENWNNRNGLVWVVIDGVYVPGEAPNVVCNRYTLNGCREWISRELEKEGG